VIIIRNYGATKNLWIALSEVVNYC
jgi:hypothetical protein